MGRDGELPCTHPVLQTLRSEAELDRNDACKAPPAGRPHRGIQSKMLSGHGLLVLRARMCLGHYGTPD